MSQLKNLNAKLRDKLPKQARYALAALTLALLTVPVIISCIPEPKERIPFTLDEGKQAQRKEVIEKMISQGIIAKIEKLGVLPHVRVTEKFALLSHDDKVTVCKVVVSFYFPDPNDADEAMVILEDWRTAKRVGTYAPGLGLSLK